MKHGKALLVAASSKRQAVRVLLGFVLLLTSAAAQTNSSSTGQALRYFVSLADPANHLVRVRLQLDPAPDTKVQLPVWNALYQVRDFAQYVSWVKARDAGGKAVPVRALDKTTWEVGYAAEVEYEIVADNAGPFGAQLTREHAFFNLAEILMYVAGRQHGSPCVVSFSDIPPEWKIATALKPVSADAPASPNTFAAETYDALADSPVEIGRFQESHFEDSGAQYRVVVDADASDYDMSAVTQIARKVAAAEVEWMQDRPFDHYVFIYHFPRRPAGGGMEHAYSTAIDDGADRVRRDPQAIAGVTAHEFFHLWNVKRIRPQSLEPVDYTREQYTRALWFSEGVTSTVADYIRVRAGLIDEKKYLEELAASIAYLESRPARLTQSVEESSLNTWLDKYPSYGQPERSISYYNKGEIVGVLLDLAVREASAGKGSLRDVFQWMNQHYAKQGRFFPDSAGVEAAAEAVSGANLRDFFTRYVAGVEPLPYNQFFATVGLRLEKRKRTLASLGFRTSRSYGQPPVVASIESGSEAERAGLRVGDVVQQVNGTPVPFTRAIDVAGTLEPLLAGLRVGDTVRLKLSGPAGTRELSFKLGGREQDVHALVDADNVTPAQRARRAAWVRGDSQP